MRKKQCVGTISVCVIAAVMRAPGVSADVVPAEGAIDARVRVAAYEENQVYRIQGAIGYALDIELEVGEHFEGLATGDLNGVDFSAQGAHLFIKPKAAAVATNLTVLTDRRVYRFDYTVTRTNDPATTTPVVYALRFTYPGAAHGSAAAPAGSTPPAGGSVERGHPDTAAAQQRRYAFCGARELRPVAVFDDGVRTTMVFGPHQPLPAVFVQEADGSEGLVNVSVEGTAILAHRTAEHWILRRGHAVGCLRAAHRGSKEPGGGAP